MVSTLDVFRDFAAVDFMEVKAIVALVANGAQNVVVGNFLSCVFKLTLGSKGNSI
jgi:hypothetical protein